MSTRLIAPIVAGLLSLGASTARAEEYKHHPLHHALHELKEARAELHGAKHDFGGHREKAIRDIDAAIKQIDELLVAAGEPFKAVKRDGAVYKKYPHHPHLHHAIHELKEAHKYLKESKDNFAGHKEKALRDIHAAYTQLEEALKFAKA